MHYLNAGHPPALLWRPGADRRPLPATTPLLSYGIDLGPQPDAGVPFVPGDRLAIFSDGLYEQRDPGGNEYGRDRLVRALAETRGSIEEVIEAVTKETRRHAAGRPAEDDVTLVLAELLSR